MDCTADLVERARNLAAAEGVADRTRFEVRRAKELDESFNLYRPYARFDLCYLGVLADDHRRA